MQANTSKCKQVQANASKSKQMQTNTSKGKEMETNASKGKQMYAKPSRDYDTTAATFNKTCMTELRQSYVHTARK